VNRAWRNSRTKPGLLLARCAEGHNYLAACDQAAGRNCPEAAGRWDRGSSVFAGRVSPAFEYACAIRRRDRGSLVFGNGRHFRERARGAWWWRMKIHGAKAREEALQDAKRSAEAASQAKSDFLANIEP